LLYGITELEEDGLRISLTIVDTPGFGDSIDNRHWYVNSMMGYVSMLDLR
jgi:cell division control protein 11